MKDKPIDLPNGWQFVPTGLKGYVLFRPDGTMLEGSYWSVSAAEEFAEALRTAPKRLVIREGERVRFTVDQDGREQIVRLDAEDGA